MSKGYYNYIIKIDGLLRAPDVSRNIVDILLKIIQSDKDFEDYYFHHVQSVSWFNYLKEEGYFEPIRIKYDENSNALFWNVLIYLDQISKQEVQYPRYSKELLNIIGDIVEFSIKRRIEKGKGINNHQIWWSCVNILNNLPNVIIKEHLSVEKFRSWLSVWTDHAMGPITDISERLLPKFLSDALTVEYAEAIIDAITEIRASEKPNTSFSREEADFVWDFYWIREAFLKNNALIGQKCSLKVIYGIANKLRKALEYKWKNTYIDIELGDEIYHILVSRIPTEGIKPDEIDFKDGQYECAVKQYSQDQLKDLGKNKDYPVFIGTDPQIELKRFTFSASNRNELVAAIKLNLPAEIYWESHEKLENKLENIFDGLFSDYSQVRIKSLVTGGRTYERGVEEVLTIVLRDILLVKCEANRTDGRQILDAFLSDKYPFPVFKRFILLCIDKFWTDYGDLMDRFLELFPDALAKSDFEVEMHDVLRNHNSEFSTALKARLKEIINAASEYSHKKDERNIAYLKYMWLSPLWENPDFSALYEEAIKKAELKVGKPYEPERLSDYKAVDVVHKSSISKEDILQISIIELVKKLNDFNGTGSWEDILQGKPDKEGLANTLQAAIKENTKKFTDEMSEFLKVDDFYIQYLIRGIKEAWNDNKEIDWERIFDFSTKYFKRVTDSIANKASPLEQGEDEERDKYLRIVGDIVELISSGCRNDKRAFRPDYFDKVEQIFNLILPLLKGKKCLEKQRDALAYAWNTTFGRVIMAYVSFSLRVARATEKKPEDWIKQKYERFFDKGIEAYILFGSYLPQMKYLDEKYTKDKIICFAQKDHVDFEWQMFMEGYLAEARVYKDVYGLMRDNYLKGLEHNVFKEQIDKKLVDHICIGYLLFNELLEDGKDSLFWKMLTSAGTLGKRERWMEVINYFWANTGRKTRKDDKDNEDKTSEAITKKILEFWAWIYSKPEIVKANLGEDYNAFLDRLAELAILIDKIDEEKEKWLMLCAPHIEQHKANFFVQSLTKFEDEESIKRIGRIFLKVLENTTPTFKEEDIVLIVRRIYEKGVRNDADLICETYGRRGLHFLRPLWEEF